ncbi:hypothetical protein [Glaciecola petra]|uniref:Uncharacterized protein n=1 Tax=Glaciecola petra TaxID=3075602 RepID=A0ABU2ZWQ1_9ALTE|nr:hypothetical protein [Aestuariibacter sp. P117]MDT0596681.1 hypothetical protein [Aestuariibacter sp. P117]
MSTEQEQSEAKQLASELLKSNDDYLEKILRLTYLGNVIHGQCWDTEFHVFGVITSDTDHLPLKKVRRYCSDEFLVKSNIETESVILFYKADVVLACNQIIEKYGNV